MPEERCEKCKGRGYHWRWFRKHRCIWCHGRGVKCSVCDVLLVTS